MKGGNVENLREKKDYETRGKRERERELRECLREQKSVNE